jgi:broad specificity phosphatase PhoE
MLISSPQIRAVETMEIAISQNEKAKNLEIHTDDRIKERSYGDLQGKSKLEDYLENPEQTEKVRRSYDFVPPNGESIEMVCRRVAEFCDEITALMKEHNINVAVSCHGNSMRGFRKYFENLSEEETATLETPLGQDYASYVI